MRKVLMVLVVFLLVQPVLAQPADTLKAMVYNLLFYGTDFGDCNSTANGVNDKDGYLETIIQHELPDILVVNELAASAIFSDRILFNSMNTNGIDFYARGAVQNNGFSSIVNQVYYNTEKLELVNQDMVDQDLFGNNITRVIDHYTFYYKDPLLEPGSDTVFFEVFGAHLKAGSSTSDETDRELAAEAVMDGLNSGDPGYRIFCGDLNLKRSTEGAYVELTSASYGDHRFYDPLDSEGNWNNASVFANVHTQSTRLSNTNNGCFSGGGMDDRFDFMMMSGQIIEDTGKVSYIQNSYRAMGQDGQHFNGELNAGGNSSEPAAVIDALYNMSDHLPVVASIQVRRIEEETSSKPIAAQRAARLTYTSEGIRISNLNPGTASIRMFDLQGTEIRSVNSGAQQVEMTMAGMPAGMFIIEVNHGGVRQTFKAVNLN